MTKTSPPFVVDDKYLNGTGLRHPSEYWTKMAPNIHLLEKRLEPEAWDALGDTALAGDQGSWFTRRDLYKPVYAARIAGNNGVLEYAAVGNGAPHSYWLRIELVPADERIRYPYYVSKCNYTEGLDLLTARELFSWDGTGWKLRETNWGKD